MQGPSRIAANSICLWHYRALRPLPGYPTPILPEQSGALRVISLESDEMTRYFFHTSDGSRQYDDVGVELADDAAARREAVRYSGSLLQDEPDIVQNEHGLRVNVVDETGRVKFAIMVTVLDPRWGVPEE